MKKILLALGVMFNIVHGQTVQQPLLVTRIPGITSGWVGEIPGCPGVVSNVSTVSRANDFHSIAVTATGTWTATLTYSNTSCSGTFYAFGTGASIDNTSATPIAWAYGNPKYVKITLTGNAVANYSASKGYYTSSASSGVAFPLDWVGQIGNKPFIDTRQYNWAPQAPGGTLAAGSVTVSMNPCPTGLPASPYSIATGNYFAQFTAGTGGTAEAAMATGGTCTSGAASGTLIFTVRFSHGAGWTIGPATQGIQESLWVAAANNDEQVLLPPGFLAMYAPIFDPRVTAGGPAINISGHGETTTWLTVYSDPSNLNTSIWTANNCGSGSQSCMGLTTTGENSSTALSVTGAANSGTGLIRLTVANHPYQVEDFVEVANVGGVSNATGVWRVTPFDANHFDLNGSTWAGTYTSGGTATQKIKGVIVVDNGDKASKLSGFGISFSQPASPSTIANITQYPTGIYARGGIGVDVDSVMLSQAWVGMDLNGVWNGSTWSQNAGRHRIRNSDIGAYRYGITVDGDLDSAYFDNLQFWPFYTMSSAQQTIYYADPTRRAMWVGRIDDGKISHSLMIGAGLDIHVGKGGGSYLGSLNDISFDGMGASTGLRITAGQITHVGGYMTIGCAGGAINGIQIDGGDYTLSTMNLHDYSCGLGNIIQINSGTVNLAGLNLFRETTNGTTMPPDVYVNGAAAQVNLTGAILARNPGTNWTNPFISVNAGRATILGNRVNGLTTGSGTFISIANDDYHYVWGNPGPGWNQSFPTAVNGQYQWAGLLALPAAQASFQNLALKATLNYSGIIGASKGGIYYCNDCKSTSPYDNTCTSGGNGATMLGTYNGSSSVWRCFDSQSYAQTLYISAETGANNAIAGALNDPTGAAWPLTTGMQVTVKLAHTLQVGANTFNLNGGGALGIKSSRNPANNIAVAYASGGVITLRYDGTQWVDVSQ
jgi:hypothetical protein